jgi:hypothetical protein
MAKKETEMAKETAKVVAKATARTTKPGHSSGTIKIDFPPDAARNVTVSIP